MDVINLYQCQGETMGTRYHASFATALNIDLNHVNAKIQQAVNTVDEQMSTWKADSDLSRFNHANINEWIAVPSALAFVVDEALKLSAITEGAFDVTLGESVNVWGFGPEGKRDALPSNHAIQTAELNSGFDKLEVRLQPPALRKSANCYIDLSGIAKGYGVDQMALVLEDLGIVDYLVSIDGEVKVRGHKPLPNKAWTIALEAPVMGEREAYDLLQPKNVALATSGNYRNVRVLDGKHYAHTLDKKSGKPVDNGVASVTVSHPSCMMADAWATALLVLGAEKGVAMAKAQQLPALFLIQKNAGISEIMTPGFAAVIG